jgi:hypothetical protein
MAFGFSRYRNNLCSFTYHNWLMKKSEIILVFFSTLLGLSNCTFEKTQNDISHINIESNLNNAQKVFISQYAKGIWYVPLESPSDHPLIWQSTTYVCISNENILDTDSRICVLYDIKGHFIREIGQLGRGPGEYQGINYITLINDLIFIHDFYTDDLIKYKLDGTFLKRYSTGFTADMEFRANDVLMLNDSLILGSVENYNGKQYLKAIIFNKEGDLKYSFRNYSFFSLKPEVKRVKVPGVTVIHRYGGEIFFKEFLNDTLFKLDKNFCLIPEYVFNLGKFKEPDSDRGKSWAEIDLFSYIDLDNIFQTKKLLILECGFNRYFPAKRITPVVIRTPGGEDYTQWYNTTQILGIYNKESGELIFSKPTSTDNHLSTSGFYNDIDAGPRFIPDKMVNDSTMVMKIRFDHLLEHIESIEFENNVPKYPEQKKRLVEFVDSLKKEGFDNPVYMFVTFKY